MKFLVGVTAIVLGSRAAMLGAPKVPTETDRGFHLGWAVGQCLVIKCQVTRGFIETDSAKSGEPIKVRVQESLYGSASPGATIAVAYEADASEYAQKDGVYRLADTWKKVKVARGTTVTVVQNLERFLG